MKKTEYQSNEHLFILASELENLNRTLIALNLGDDQRMAIMREYPHH